MHYVRTSCERIHIISDHVWIEVSNSSPFEDPSYKSTVVL